MDSRSADPAGKLKPGFIVDGKFELQRFVAAGGMGFIYQARSLQNHRPLALKIMREALRNDPVTSKRFIREAETIRRLFHPNTVALIDHGESPDGLLYIAMEWLQGEDLADRLHRQGPLSPKEAAQIALEICRGLVEAHAKGIIHRDLKPENIFLHKQNGQELVKVLDFGIAKAVAGPVQTQLTRMGMVCGTPDFMSPEQARGDKLDARSDVYALGCVLYMLLTGEVPFPAENAVKVVLRHLSDPFPTLPAHVPTALAAIIETAVRKEPAQRYHNARQMAEALAAFLCVDIGIDARATLEQAHAESDPLETRNQQDSQLGEISATELADDENASTELAIPALLPLEAIELDETSTAIAPVGGLPPKHEDAPAMAETALAVEPISPPSPPVKPQQVALGPSSPRLPARSDALSSKDKQRAATVLLAPSPKARSLSWWPFVLLFALSIAGGAAWALLQRPPQQAPATQENTQAKGKITRLQLTSNVPAQVKSPDGVELGQTPLWLEAEGALEGHYVLSAVGHRSVKRWVSLRAGEEKSLQVVLPTSRMVRCELSTQPSGATIWHDQSQLGETPKSLDLEATQPIRLRFEKEGYQSETRALTFPNDGSACTLHLEMTTSKSTSP